MQRIEMPLLSYVSSLYASSDFSNTLIIACQHVLGTQLNLFNELFQKCLEPKNLYLIGKNYSTNEEVYEEFLRQKVNIVPESKEYDSHESFDIQFQLYVEKFLERIVNEVDLSVFSKIIVVDEGGHLILSSNKLGQTVNLVSIEQTSSGYEKIKSKSFDFPIINVARSHAKLEIEAPLIAELVVNKIEDYLTTIRLSNPRILVIGQGSIGSFVKKLLMGKYDVKGFDIETHKSDLGDDYREHLREFDVIIGATGQSILTTEDFKLLKNGVHLISVSSSDREFSAVELRKLFPKNRDVHATLKVNGISLVNSGFPINFTGAVESLPTEQAQLTVALMLSSIYEANDKTFSAGLNDLNFDTQDKISQKFRELLPGITLLN